MNNTQSTTVNTIDVDIDSWLGAPGADSIVTSGSEETKKPSMFSQGAPNMDFLDADTQDGEDKKDGDVSRGTTSTKEVFDDLDKDLNLDGKNEDDDQEDDKKPGRPKTEKSGLVNFLKKRIESKEMFAFDDYDDSKQSLDEYLGSLSEKDVDELWKANIDNIKTEVANQTPKEFFESLPDELQFAAKYVMDGGQDLKACSRHWDRYNRSGS